ncbi:hypothetical protein BAUCODRAFT_286166 [Baudoinia panamericana UAMH 10762]|uniref:Uncharacterized protein n=1 Tax=Baudoinia panamericana (strain UAMH 10762) TaxID=717646 RepID=M2LED4_BAUPA|nr:uncharacterized protein BAUCODRAFT_286166 [Baudoinia panamericana UAMH 10762]EMC92357.1 hypothetical protein BAUCODRAFT_286166 [Baudoinia panamericana UAMH 10762]
MICLFVTSVAAIDGTSRELYDLTTQGDSIGGSNVRMRCTKRLEASVHRLGLPTRGGGTPGVILPVDHSHQKGCASLGR